MSKKRVTQPAVSCHSRKPHWVEDNQNMPQKTASTLLRYSVAVLTVAIALIVRLPVWSVLGKDAPFLTFFPAVLVSAVYGGFDAGLIATLLSGLVVNYFVVPPAFSFSISKPSDVANLILYFGTGVFISWLGGFRVRAIRERMRLLEQDLTTRKQLEEVRDQFFDVVENTHDGFYILDRQWRFKYVNPRAVEITRKSQEELLGQIIWDVFPEALEQKDYGEFHRAREEQVPVKFENFYQPYGIWYEIDIYPAKQGLSVFVRDVTERKRAEVSLRESEQRFKMLADNVPVHVWMDDKYGHGRFTNARFLQFSGISEQNLPQTWLDILHPEDAEHYLAEYRAAIAQRVEHRRVVRLRRYDGVYRWFEVIGLPRFESDRFIGYVGCNIDITERMLFEKALRQSEERFRLASRAVAGIVYDWNVQTGEVYRSEGLYQLIGVRPEDAPQTRDWWSERIHPDDYARIKPMWLSMLPDDDCYDFEYRFRHEDGHWVDLWDRGYLIRHEKGELLRIVGSSTDISERKRVEEERQRILQLEKTARAEAEAANRIKDEFLAVLSHELRSPLNPILGWAQLLQSREFDKVTFQKAISTIERNARLQAQLIEDLLDVSRILQGKLSLNMFPVNLLFTIEAALETVWLAAEAKNIHIQTTLDKACEQVLGDSARLQQVIWNLVSNAVKFTPEGGKVDVQLECIDSYAQIIVTDTGKGINPDFLPYVFDYFRQADSTTTRKFGGLGLGLAIVHHLVELHGGTVWGNSPGEGQGATFTVKLPLIKENILKEDTTTTGSSAAASNALPLANIKILVVDDEEDNREFFSFVLQEFGASVTAVPSAGEALQVLTQAAYDILLSDIGMPNTDGYMLIRQVRDIEAEHKKPQIQAIALTAYAGEMNQQQALSAGFQLHIPKPVGPEELLKAISSLI
jgi:PAS domain S-box-containing protein